MKKRLLSTLLALSIVLSLLPGTALAAETDSDGTEVLPPAVEDEEFETPEVPEIAEEFQPDEEPLDEYEVLEAPEETDSDITLYASTVAYRVTGGNLYFDPTTGAITDCGGGVTSAVIPSSINGVAVTSIGDNAFRLCQQLTSVTIPNSVTSIGDNAFHLCQQLTSVTIPNSVTSIGNWAFSYCSSLASVNIPSSVTHIGDYAFQFCQQLTSVTIPNSVTSIGEGAFACSGLVSVTISNRLTSIGTCMFQECNSLKSVTIPNSVTSIGHSAFDQCGSLTRVTIPNSVTSIENRAFSDCSALTSVTIPGSVTSIGDWAFYNCNSLASVTISNGVTSIGVAAFLLCNSLTSITIPGSVTNLGDAFSKCAGLKSVTISSGVTTIGSYAFSECTSLESVTIPNSVTAIEFSAFTNCSKLKEVRFRGSEGQWNRINIEFDNDELNSAAKVFERDWDYVDRLTKNSLINADNETNGIINNAIYNLLFKAHYRPVESNISKALIPNKPSFTGSLEVMRKWPLQNDYQYLATLNGKKMDYGPTKCFDDPVLGKVKFAEGGWGCMSYALFATAYTYGTSGSAKMCGNKSASGVKEFFHTWADPGEQIRWEPPNKESKGTRHSIVFLGEDNAGAGFYYITYSGGTPAPKAGETYKGTLPASSQKHNLYLAYKTYADLAALVSKEGLTLSVRDTNGGSYYKGTAKAAGAVRVSKKVTRTVLKIACPVEAVIRYEGETLDSRDLTESNQTISASFGSVKRNGEGIIFDLDPNIDYDLEIIGTDEGTMDLTVEYHDEDAGKDGEDTVIDTRKFEGYPITASTEIQASSFDPLASFVLYGSTASNDSVVWGTGINETVTAETADEGLYSSENNAPETDIVLIVDFPEGDRFHQYTAPSTVTDSAKNGYAIAALYESCGKLREIVRTDIEEAMQHYNLQFKSIPDDSDNVKIFLFDQSLRPLLQAYDIPLSPVE